MWIVFAGLRFFEEIPDGFTTKVSMFHICMHFIVSESADKHVFADEYILDSFWKYSSPSGSLLDFLITICGN